MIFKNGKVYDVIRWVAAIGIPALGSLYFGLAKFFPLPYADNIVGACGVIATFLSTIVGISKYQYMHQSEIPNEQE